MCEMRLWVLLAPALVVGGIGIVDVVDAAPARADCVSSGGTTICSQGDVRGADTGEGPGSTGGSGYGYMCGYDWDCDYGWGVDFDVDLSPGPRPPGGIGGPGGGGGGRPGGGGGRGGR